MSKDGRGWGTTLVASLGLLGAVVAGIVGDVFPWRIAFFVGGGLGLLLLALRFGVRESAMFTTTRKAGVPRGSLLALFASPRRAMRYARGRAGRAPDLVRHEHPGDLLARAGPGAGTPIAPSAGKAVMFAYVGATLGDLASVLSQLIRSRKKTLFIFLLDLRRRHHLLPDRRPSLGAFYGACFLLGLLGLLGRLRHRRGRAVRHQPPGHGRLDRAELRPGRGGADDAALSGAGRPPWGWSGAPSPSVSSPSSSRSFRWPGSTRPTGRISTTWTPEP